MSDIGYEGDLPLHNSSTLTTSTDQLPSAAVIAMVEGNSTEVPAAAFTSHLEQRAQMLGMRIEEVRQYVQQNAEALAQAVTTLRDRDEMNASDATNALSLIDAAATPPSAGSRSPFSSRNIPL
ncbi:MULTISPECIES: hypothetical protein [unclassified Microbacterium]|uniref:hypothetical protein n=1 Tax=unclassified Microbacterium TaxID=2609290 RepID=UPI0006FA3D5F|nr:MULTISPECIES: hypothetical protein [unclassified Microbacterium]AOX45625.1 hypothetical protein BJP65_07255 [Microbacterium sp. BH-3-3-3]KQR88674.1 hypothetical protein ASF96_02535 [Microbacterium sp. Leaf179]KQT74966.1 hypothetical protein ASG45_00125 [Microbacterium sp. Leaf436]MBD8206901.1 hypothetical protein [Microbacterium sp. CFBP 8801]MBD8217040.1 hypothetical protein [Microbacterium sp. CFBP 13617]